MSGEANCRTCGRELAFMCRACDDRVAELEAFLANAAGICEWGCASNEDPPCLTCQANRLLGQAKRR